MSNYNMCRVCLSYDIRMYSISETRYQEMYEKHTGSKLIIKNRPNTICYICNLQLVKLCKFFQISKRAERFFSEMYRSGVELTKENVSSLNNVLKRLSVTNLRNMSITDTPINNVEVIPVEDNEDLPDKEAEIPSGGLEVTPPEDIEEEDIALDEEIDIETVDEEIMTISKKVTEDVDIKIESVDYKEIDLDGDTSTEDVSISDMNSDDEYSSDQDVDYPEASALHNTDVNTTTIEIELPAKKNDSRMEHLPERNVPTKKTDSPMEYLIERNEPLNEIYSPMEYLIERNVPAKKTDGRMEYSEEKNVPKKTGSLKITEGSKEPYKLPHVIVSVERIPFKAISELANLAVKDKYYYCKECSYKSPYKIMLDKHSKMHELKVFRCTVCSKRFQSASHLCRHSKTTHHRLECKLCGKIFKKFEYLQKHMRIIHSNQKYPCEFCNRSFSHRSTLLVHTRTHTGEKPFGCKWCEKKFNDKSNCRKHMKTHVTQHACFMCDKVFRERKKLMKHAIDHIL